MKKILFVTVVLALVIAPTVLALDNDAIANDGSTDIALSMEQTSMETAEMLEEEVTFAPKYLWVALIAIIIVIGILIYFEVRNNTKRR